MPDFQHPLRQDTMIYSPTYQHTLQHTFTTTSSQWTMRLKTALNATWVQYHVFLVFKSNSINCLDIAYLYLLIPVRKNRTNFFSHRMRLGDEPPCFTMVPRLSIPKGLPGIATPLSRLLEALVAKGVAKGVVSGRWNAKHQLIYIYLIRDHHG